MKWTISYFDPATHTVKEMTVTANIYSDAYHAGLAMLKAKGINGVQSIISVE